MRRTIETALVPTQARLRAEVPVNADVRLSRAVFDAVVMDLDGVVTDTASVHKRAWKRLFDGFLATLPPREGQDHRPFADADYRLLVDGRPRDEGVRCFLAARGIEVAPQQVDALAQQKDRDFQNLLRSEGVRLIPGAVPLLTTLGQHGFRTAIVSASRHCADVLGQAGLSMFFDASVDGVVAAELGLPGKPDPAVYLEAVRRLGTEPARAVVIEDALPGVEAGRQGGFALVVGVGSGEHGRDLLAHGADVVVRDLAGIDVVRSPAMQWHRP